MTASPRQQAATADQLRLDLACTLIKRERLRRKESSEEFSANVGIGLSTLSKIENHRPVKGDTITNVGIALEWGAFLDFVRAGSIEEVQDSTGVDPEIRRFAAFRLREIAGQTRST